MSSSETPALARRKDTFAALAQWLESRVADLKIPGVAVGVTTAHGRFTHGIGEIESGSEQSITAETRFGIASLSKIFTATALSSLAATGALSLDDPVIRYLPDLRLGAEADTKALTVGHLLSHSGGWADVLEPVPGQDALAWYATQLESLQQVAPVGSQFGYGNSGFMLAGAVIEQVTGLPFEDAIADLVLKPLGMANTGFTSSGIASGNRAVGHQLDGEIIPLDEIPRPSNPVGGLLSTLHDMLAFVEAHADIAPAGIATVALAPMRQPRIAGGSVGPIVVDGIGLGWMLLDIDSETVLMSQAGDSGLISAMIAVPSRQFGMVVLANSDAAMTLVNDAVLLGLREFTGLVRPEPEPYRLTEDQAAAATGQFGLAEWMTFETTPVDGALQVTASAGGEAIPELSGTFTMVSPTQGFMPYLGGSIWLDLVPDDGGDIRWLRFAARLLPRIQ